VASPSSQFGQELSFRPAQRSRSGGDAESSPSQSSPSFCSQPSIASQRSTARAPRTPLRFTLRSYDRLSQVCMKLEWLDNGVEHAWKSWEDAMCGYYEAVKLLAPSCTDIKVSFRSMPGGHKTQKVNRQRKCAWQKGEEIICFRMNRSFEPAGIDVVFEMRGPLLHCYIHRAWNLHNVDAPRQDWEHWPGGPQQTPLPIPSTLRSADKEFATNVFANMHSEDQVAATVSIALGRLKASAGALLEVRRRTHSTLEDLQKRLSKQWYTVNSSNTVAAGLAVASFGTLIAAAAPPVGIALGVGSAAVGMGATARDVAGDSSSGNRFSKVVLEDMWETLGFEAIEAEFRETMQLAAESVTGPRSLYKARNAFAGGASAMAIGAHSARIGAAVARGAKLGRTAFIARAGQGFNAASKVLGGVGAGLAVGIAVHGWSTATPSQKMVAEKLEEVARSMDYLMLISEQVDSALTCPLCTQPLEFGWSDQGIRRCQQFHCFHGRCLQELGGCDAYCPLCPQAGSCDLTLVSTGQDRLRALLCLAGMSSRTLTVDGISPRVLKHARSMAKNLRGRVRLGHNQVQRDGLVELLEGHMPDDSNHFPQECRTGSGLSEDASAHLLWHDAVTAAGGNPQDLDDTEVDGLMCGSSGMPLKYRHVLWPQWLRVQHHQEIGRVVGHEYGDLKWVDLPPRVLEVIDADIPRTHFLPPEHKDALRRILVAVSAKSPQIGYAQGMNFIAAVFLKLGFEEEDAFWMLVAVLEDVLPLCHAPTLEGLFRDTAVADALLQTYLPGHAVALESVDVRLIWITADFFLSLGTKVADFGMVVRLWDFIMHHGPRGLFAGLLALLTLYFPVREDGSQPPEADAEEMLLLYRANIRDGVPQDLADVIVDLLYEQQGGLSRELVLELRSSIGQRPITGMDSFPMSLRDSARRSLVGLCTRAARLNAEALGQAGEDILERLLELSVDESNSSIGGGSDDSTAASSKSSRRKQVRRLKDTMRSCSNGGIPPISSSNCLVVEDGEVPDVWLEAAQVVDTFGKMSSTVVDDLLLQGHPLPMQYRRELWIEWLGINVRKADAESQGKSYEEVLEKASMAKLDSGSLWSSDLMAIHAQVRRVVAAVCAALSDDTVELDDEKDAGDSQDKVSCLRSMERLCQAFVQFGFTEEMVYWLTLTVVTEVRPTVQYNDLGFIFRDNAVADVLVHTLLPSAASTISAANMSLLHFSGDFFLTLGCNSAPMPVVACLWDLIFRFGQKALFSGFLAYIDLYLPEPEEDNANLRARELQRGYRSNLSKGTPEEFVQQVLHFMQHNHGGLPEEVIAALRENMEPGLQSEGRP